nr:hypothetical protein CFP56_56059 [Quercus suber]
MGVAVASEFGTNTNTNSFEAASPTRSVTGVGFATLFIVQGHRIALYDRDTIHVLVPGMRCNARVGHILAARTE